MDTPAQKTPPLFSMAIMGQNSHVRFTHILETLQADQNQRRANRKRGVKFPGQNWSYPVGHMLPLGGRFGTGS